ncbi:MAG: phage Gp37/Gp68 family protein [Rhodanobacter sp.]
MAETTNIEWCDSTFNPWIGCTKISQACDFCYAADLMDSRVGKVRWGSGQPRIRTGVKDWKLPLRWDAKPFYECRQCRWRGDHPDQSAIEHLVLCPACRNSEIEPARRRVFCASLADVFDNEVDPRWRADLFALIEKTPNLDWLVLTKRIGNVPEMAGELARMLWWPSLVDNSLLLPKNVWLGATVCNQAEADRDIPKLLKVPASVRFLSIEPLLGPVDLSAIRFPLAEHSHEEVSVLHRKDPHALGRARPTIDWVIVGGESGKNARPMHPEWPRSLRDQCLTAGTPFLFKQWGEWVPATSGMWFDPLVDGPAFASRAAGRDTFDFGNGYGAVRVGKRASGRQLNGADHNGYPELIRN